MKEIVRHFNDRLCNVEASNAHKTRENEFLRSQLHLAQKEISILKKETTAMRQKCLVKIPQNVQEEQDVQNLHNSSDTDSTNKDGVCKNIEYTDRDDKDTCIVDTDAVYTTDTDTDYVCSNSEDLYLLTPSLAKATKYKDEDGKLLNTYSEVSFWPIILLGYFV